MDDSNNIYVFLSHSLKDYDNVCRVRNILEKDGFRPIMLFLKAFEDHPDDEMLRTLIGNEIDARHRFILCKSKFTDPPKGWVKFEVDHILNKEKSELRNYYYQTVDIEQSDESLRKQLNLFRKNSTVYISCSRKDDNYYIKIKKALIDKLDLRVFDFKNDIPSGVDYNHTILNAIEEAANNGVFIPVITENSLNSDFCRKEIWAAQFFHSKRIVPFVDIKLKKDSEKYREFVFLLGALDCVMFDSENLDSAISELASVIMNMRESC